MRWKTRLIAVAAAVLLSVAPLTTGAFAHGGGHGGGGFGGGGHGGFGGHGFSGHGFSGHGFGGHGFVGRGFGGHGFVGRGFGGHAFVGGRFGHFDHGHFGRFGFRRHFFFAGVGPGFYDWPYYDYSYSGCRVLTPYGWVWACQ
jgi:hypothetical protein